MTYEYTKRHQLLDGLSLDFIGDGTRGPLKVTLVSGGSETVLSTAGLRMVQQYGHSDERQVFGLSADGSIWGPSSLGAATWPLVLFDENAQELERPIFQDLTIRPTQDVARILLSSHLRSEHVAGEFGIEIHSPSTTEIVADVVASIEILRPVGAIGVAPLSTMFLFGEGSRFGFPDYRIAVHDSDGLWMRGEDGRVTWRSLNNPPAVANSYFTHTDPSAFGLVQRAREFHSYQDEKAQFERRPSLVVEPHDGWGNGFIRLIELPNRSEHRHNVVVSWMPKVGIRTGVTAEFRYRLRWNDFTGSADDLGKVNRVAVGAGGVSGVEGSGSLRKFVVDFAGPKLNSQKLPNGPVDAFVTVSPGQIEHVAVFPLVSPDTFRLVIDATIETDDPIELRAYLIAGGRQLTETWVYQWRRAGPPKV